MFVKSLAVSTRIKVKNTGTVISNDAAHLLINDSIEKSSVRGVIRDEIGIATMFTNKPIMETILKLWTINGSVPIVAKMEEIM